jgi:two-component system phosphate regulon response regulator PhoB
MNIFLDVRLPDGNGIGICKMLKINPTTRHIPVLLMSANDHEHQNTACAEAFISKQFHIKKAFRDKVESLLEG